MAIRDFRRRKRRKTDKNQVTQPRAREKDRRREDKVNCNHTNNRLRSHTNKRIYTQIKANDT